MRRYSRFIILLLILIVSPCAFAVTGEGIDFSVTRVQKGLWAKSRHHLANDWVQHLPDKDEKLSYIAVSYNLTNNNQNRKLDLTQGFEFSLKDEFGNTYRRLKKPVEYLEPVLQVSKNFPSLYPGESYGETLFFEAPVTAASRVVLGIDARSIGIQNEITFPLDTEKTGQQQNDNKPKETNRITPQRNQCPLEILTPHNGDTIDGKKPVRVQVSIRPDSLPERITITGPGVSLTDPAPKAENTYDFMLPADQPKGIGVIIAATQSSPEKNRTDCNDSIFVYVDN